MLFYRFPTYILVRMFSKDEKLTLPNEDKNNNKSTEIPEDVGSWILEEGVTINELENKSNESLSNKKSLFDKISNLLISFQEFYKSRIALYISVVGLSILIVVEMIQGVSFTINIPGLRFGESIATLILFAIALYKIISFLILEKEAWQQLTRMEENNDTVQKGHREPDAIELMIHTFVPKVKDFMEAYAARSDQERLKETLLNSLLVYGISNDSVVAAVRRSGRIFYSESSRLSYLIGEILKSSNLDPSILNLAYYDYIKSPIAKDHLKKIVQKKDLRKKIISIISTKLMFRDLKGWVSKIQERILVIVLDNLISENLEYSISDVKVKTEEIINTLISNQLTFSNNLYTFGFDLGKEYLENCKVDIESIEALINGEYLEKCALKKISGQFKDLKISHLKLIYHYNEPGFSRALRLRSLDTSERKSFAKYISENVLKINLKVDEITLSHILYSVGDYRIENLSQNFGKIVDAIEFLKKAKEALEVLEIKTVKNPSDANYIQDISTIISKMPDSQWISSWLKFFQELVDWDSELSRMFPDKPGVSREQYSTLLFLIFSNGKLHLQPIINKRMLNQHFSNEANVETRLLRFIELAESGSPKEIPRLIAECLEFQYGQNNQLYLSLFHREFVSGTLPTYYFLVWYSNKGYFEESQQITTIKTEVRGDLAAMKKIVDKIFTMTLNEDFVKSLLIGGVVKAYLIIKFSGQFFTLLDHGTKDYSSAPSLKSFKNFLQEQQNDTNGGQLPKGLKADYYYRIDSSPHSARIGLVPENMSFLEFANSLDSFLRKYFVSLFSNKRRLSKSTETNEGDIEENLNYPRWEILPLDISTVRKAIEEQGAYIKEKEYIKSIERFLTQEDTTRKLAWIGVMQTQGDSSDSVNLRTVVREILRKDSLGFSRYMEFSRIYFEAVAETENRSEVLERDSQSALTALNNAILRTFGVDNFLEVCRKINDLTSGKKNLNAFEKSLLSVQFSSQGKDWKLTSSGLDYISKLISEVSQGVKILLDFNYT